MLTRADRSRRSRRAITVTTTIAAVMIAAFAACTSSSSKSATNTAAPSTAKPGSTCKTTPPTAVVSAPVDGVASDRVIDSFDGTKIRIHWFPRSGSAASGLPTILMGPGWGSGGSTDTGRAGAEGQTSIKDLHDAGYNVLTWDPRGFGLSTGTVEVNSAKTEGRDVQRIIDWTAAQPGVQLDAPGDPRLGMVGVSYGGGIQVVTAAIDCRVDAIVPSWAWHSLTTSLYKSKTVKLGWGSLLYLAAASRPLDPHIESAYRAGISTGVLTRDDADWFADRGPADLVKQINVPTLFLQGTVDTLFTLDEAIENYRILRGRGVETAMNWYCAGHGVCLTEAGNRDSVSDAALAWLARFVKRDATAPRAPRFAFVDQNGTAYRGDDYPLPAGTPITAGGQGTLPLVATAASRSGPAHPASDNPDALAQLVAPITPAQATTAVSVTVVGGAKAAVIVGAPSLRITYRGRVDQHNRPTRVFAQLVDDKTGFVVGNQVTPIPVTLDGSEHTTTIPLESVAFALEPGQKLVLQIVATTVAYAQPQLGGEVDIKAQLTLPVARGLTK